MFGGAGGVKEFARTELAGAVTMTGGVSGIEGSMLALLACLVIGAYLLLRARRKGNFVRPFWRQQHDLFITTTETRVAEL